MCSPDIQIEGHGKWRDDPVESRRSDGKRSGGSPRTDPTERSAELYEQQNKRASDVSKASGPPPSAAKDPVDPNAEETAPWWTQ